MSDTITTRFDVAEYLRTLEEMAAYLEACFEEADGDAAFVAKALGNIARAKGLTQVARDAGLSRESLYKALSGERTPSFDTILKVIIVRSANPEHVVCIGKGVASIVSEDLERYFSGKYTVIPQPNAFLKSHEPMENFRKYTALCIPSNKY